MMVHSTPDSSGGLTAPGPRWARTWISWAAMATAISAGVWPPMDRPMGEYTPSSISWEKPSSRRALYTAATLVRLPIMPT